LIKKSLEDLFRLQSEFILSAVKGGSRSLSTGEHLSNFDSLYFNAGVLLINMDKWLNSDTESSLVKLGSFKDYPLMDQDILNLVFKENWKELEDRYNFQQMSDLSDPPRENVQSPVIIHFVGVKPWSESRSTPYVYEYRMQFNKIRSFFPTLRDEEAL
jgi:lipopolysaccharide biosynthesis glycosyltransferase